MVELTEGTTSFLVLPLERVNSVTSRAHPLVSLSLFDALTFHMYCIASITRPMILATALCMMANPKAAQIKLKLIFRTFQFLLLSKDKKWKKSNENPASYFTNVDESTIQRKTVIFLRHGESTWNDTFNKGDRSTMSFLLGFVPGLVRSVSAEWYFLVTGRSSESWFYDSPLSQKGIQQAEAVAKYLRETDPQYTTPKEARLLRLIKGEAQQPSGEIEKCQLLSSNLRRAISTCAIALHDRLDKCRKDDTIIILEELQEASTNPDALSITLPFSKAVTSFTDSDRVKEIYATQVDTSKNIGNKPLKSNGMIRMQGLCTMLFSDGENGLSSTTDNVLCTGHSYWFRAFFQTYLPTDFDHVCKKKKLINGGIAGFTLLHTKTESGESKYMIDPSSLVVLYGGF
jgi:broad specificity phosphatase PhoE